jgi:hypothetical protein
MATNSMRANYSLYMCYPTSYGSRGCLCCPYYVAAGILDNPTYHIHLILNVPYRTPPLTLPFITMERKKLWITLRLVVSIDMKWKVSREVLVFVIHVLEVFLMNNVIHNIPPCIWIMIFLI